ncbi:MAG: pyruvate ferredoxin oxidoreductase [Actinomycetia bacterium]|nr:pyruvate ferredoxin oxidoreductase [Actinomycetes bacterium]
MSVPQVTPLTLKDLARREERAPRFLGGHALCAGCGIPAVVRTVLNSIDTPVVVANATGCLEVATTRYPDTAWNVPWIHVAFENAAAVMSGIEAAWRALRRRGSPLADGPVTFVVFAGDGGTYDIGLQALSGALDRGHRLLYVCYDNEAYMNTGIQRSGATPFGARTSTTPVGAREAGNLSRRKDLTAIVAAHHIPYVAQAAMSHLADLSLKVRRAAAADGPAFLNVLSACPLGWGTEPRDSVEVVRLAVETAFWPLYEVVSGRWRLTYEPGPVLPLVRFLERQARFRHLLADPERLAEAEHQVEEEWRTLQTLAERDRAAFEA